MRHYGKVIVAIAAMQFISPGFTQQGANPDPTKLAQVLQQQRDAANNQVALLALQLQDAQVEIGRLREELAKRPAAPEGASK